MYVLLGVTVVLLPLLPLVLFVALQAGKSHSPAAATVSTMPPINFSFTLAFAVNITSTIPGRTIQSP